MCQSNTKAKTGELRYDGQKRMGRDTFEWSSCVDCGTSFPHIDRTNDLSQRQHPEPSCNGRNITKCPWCRPDSKPWTNGRGG